MALGDSTAFIGFFVCWGGGERCAFLGTSMKIGVRLRKYLRNEMKNPEGILYLIWKHGAFFIRKGIFRFSDGVDKGAGRRRVAPTLLACARFTTDSNSWWGLR